MTCYNFILRLKHLRGYVMPGVGNLKEEKSCLINVISAVGILVLIVC
jgi:hypothetical protein